MCSPAVGEIKITNQPNKALNAKHKKEFLAHPVLYLISVVTESNQSLFTEQLGFGAINCFQITKRERDREKASEGREEGMQIG